MPWRPQWKPPALPPLILQVEKLRHSGNKFCGGTEHKRLGEDLNTLLPLSPGRGGTGVSQFTGGIWGKEPLMVREGRLSLQVTPGPWKALTSPTSLYPLLLCAKPTTG